MLAKEGLLPTAASLWSQIDGKFKGGVIPVGLSRVEAVDTQAEHSPWVLQAEQWKAPGRGEGASQLRQPYKEEFLRSLFPYSIFLTNLFYLLQMLARRHPLQLLFW